MQLHIKFDMSQQYSIGDRWIFNVRGTGDRTGTPKQITGNNGLPNVPSGILPHISNEYGGHSILKGPGPIYPGAQININIVRDCPPQSGNLNASSMSWVSVSFYRDIEEWFWASGAYQSFDQNNQSGVGIGANAVTFRSGIDVTSSGDTNSIVQTNNTGAKFMLIRGFNKPTNQSNARNEIQANLKVKQTVNC
jgi:hypothetical protein